MPLRTFDTATGDPIGVNPALVRYVGEHPSDGEALSIIWFDQTQSVVVRGAVQSILERLAEQSE